MRRFTGIRTGFRRQHTMIRTATKQNMTRWMTVAGIAFLVGLGACSHEVGLFASLEQEIPVDEERGFPTNGSIHGLVFHETGGTGRYFAGGSSLWVREAVDASETSLEGWTRIAPPSSGLTLSSMALVGGEIFAVYGGNVYSRTAGDQTGVSWGNPVAAFDTATALQVFAVTVGGTDTFVVSASVEGGNRLLDNSGAEISGLENVNTIYDVTNFGDRIYVLTNTQLFRGAENDLLTGMAPVTIAGSTSSTFRDMQVRGDDDDELWIAGKGRLYWSNDGTNWTNSDSITPEDSSTEVQFTGLGFVTVDGTEYVLASTQANGLYEGNDPDDLSSLRAEGSERTLIGRSGNYLTTQIAGRAVDRIVIDANGSARGLDGPLVFLGTPGRGLWRGQQENGDFIWRRE